MMPFDAYRCYLSLKNHFTKDHYDYHKYRGKTRATVQAFYKRKDRFWFEKFARQKNDKEVEEFFVSNFIYSTDPATMWIGEMIKEGEGRYQEWKKKTQSLSYIFKEEVENVFEEQKVDDVFNCSKGHPPILKSYLGGDTSLETMVILDGIFDYSTKWDKKMSDDVVWPDIKKLIENYKKFLTYQIDSCRMVVTNLTTME